MENKHTLRDGDSIYTKCANCNLDCHGLYNIFRKKNKYDHFFSNIDFINNNIPCLTKEEWIIKELLE